MDGKDLAELVINSLEMPAVLRYYGFEVNRDGFTRCPFHSERTASFKAYSGNRGFYCFGCGTGGSVIDFVKKYFSLTFIEAVKKLNSDFCLNLPIEGRPSLRQKRAAERIQAQMSEKQAEYDKLMQEYYKALEAYARCDKILAELKPMSEDEPLKPEFLKALQNIDFARYKLNEVEGRLIEYEYR